MILEIVRYASDHLYDLFQEIQKTNASASSESNYLNFPEEGCNTVSDSMDSMNDEEDQIELDSLSSEDEDATLQEIKHQQEEFISLLQKKHKKKKT